MFCYRCGNRLPEESVFCNRCGIRLQSTTERMRSSTPFHSDEEPDSDYRSSRRVEVRQPSRRRHEDDELVYDHEETNVADDWEEFDPEIEDEEEEFDSPRHSYRGPRERVIFSINPAFYPVTSSYVLSIFSALLLAMIISFFNGGFFLAMAIASIAFVPSFIKHIRHIHTIFTLTSIKLEISEGLFSKSTRNIPLRHVQDVAVRENFKERMMGIGDIIVDTPAMDSKLILNNVNNPRHYADLILEQLERWN